MTQKKFRGHRRTFKNYKLRSDMCFLISAPLMGATLYFFLSSFNISWTWILTAQWSTVFFIVGFEYVAINNSRHSRHVATTTRREELSFLMLRFIFVLPLLILLFGEIQSKVDGILMLSSVVCMLTLALSLDLFEFEILLPVT